MLRGKPPSEAKPARPRMLIYGEAGIGKTWGSFWQDCYFVDTEGGASLPNYVEKLEQCNAQYLGPEDGACDVAVLLSEVMALATVEHDRKTLVIDSITKVFNTAVQIEHDRIVESGRVPQFGAEKKPAVALMRRMLRWFDRLDMNVILIAHERPLWSDGEEIGKTFDCWDKLRYELSLVLQILQYGDEVKARVVKSRYDAFKAYDLIDWDVRTFQKHFDTIDNVAKPVEMITDEQLATINELTNLWGGCPWEEKWFDAAGATCWTQMPRDVAEKCIVFWERKEQK